MKMGLPRIASRVCRVRGSWLVVLSVLFAVTQTVWGGWYYRVSAISLGVLGGVKNSVYANAPKPGPVPGTTSTLFLTGELLSAAIGWNFANNWGSALGSRLFEYLQARPLSGHRNEMYSVLPLAIYVTKGVGTGVLRSGPTLTAFAQGSLSLTADYRDLPIVAPGLSAGVSCQWNLGSWGLDIGLRASRYLIGSADEETTERLTCIGAGVALRHGAWRAFGEM